jgi:hypothetical protein
MVTAYAKNNVFYRKLQAAEKKKLTYIDRLKENKTSRSEYNKVIREIDQRKALIAQKWDPDLVNNEFLNSSVSLMDGRQANSQENVFLSSFKNFGKGTIRTWNYNILVLIVYLFVFNIITMMKLKYLFKE